MARAKTAYRCTECGAAAPQWTGWCSACGASGTLAEEAAEVPGIAASGAASTALVFATRSTPVPIVEAIGEGGDPTPTGLGELDRVLGGGFVPGSVTLLGGEPGIGKSTLLLQALAAIADGNATCLYVSAEESARQVALRAERLGIAAPALWLVAETALPHVLDHVASVRPDVVVVDSIQTVHDPDLSSAPGSVGQVRGCAHRLVVEAKQRGTTTILVGHVTKDGALAGPRVLEHLVDTVLSFEGERHHALRLLRPVKHRFGGTHELGLFEMGDSGLAGVPDPSALFLADRQPGIPGSVVAPVLDGQRPLLVEVQALVVPSQAPMPRRTAQGVDSGRLAQVLAVIERHAGIPLGRSEVHVAVAGGVRVPEPGADLAVALAVASAATNRPVAANVVVCGEMGLGGELRQVQRTDRRLAEAARLGFEAAIVPRSAPEPPPGLKVARAPSLRLALQAAGIIGTGGPARERTTGTLPVRAGDGVRGNGSERGDGVRGDGSDRRDGGYRWSQ
ncbi:MAG TPA: DNA repair protein RadA [Acidimicrobiales bacterium]|nr:DNA repair protein RadA [Acidimicrobiales bacterium]